MNDNQITDDLLEELEELESSATAMDEQLSDAQAKTETLEKLDSPASIDATSLALEAAKMAQDAAAQSQKAAEASLNHAHRQKEQVMELSDANFSWRQAVKSANKELSTAKSHFSIMLSVSLVTSVAALSAMGWLLYSMQKKEASFRGEILDILQTENAILSKQITVKVDELSALIELMTADMQKLTRVGVTSQASSVDSLPVLPVTQGAQTSTEEVPVKKNEQATSQESIITPKPEPADKTPQVELSKEHSQITAPASTNQLDVIQPPAFNPEQFETHYTELKALIEKILDQQAKLQAKTLAPQASNPTTNLSSGQEKQLKDISWLVRKQSKTLEQIQQTISGSAPASGNTTQADTSNRQAYQAIQGSLVELKDQLSQLRAQQNQLQTQVDGLQKETKKLSDAAKPYSYQLK